MGSRTSVSKRDFVMAIIEAQKAGNTVDGMVRLSAVAKATGLTPASAYSKANALRKDGVNLPKLTRKGDNDVSVDELNALFSNETDDEKGEDTPDTPDVPGDEQENSEGEG